MYKEIQDLKNPAVILTAFCNRLINHFEDRTTFEDPEDVIRKAYDEEKKSLIRRMKTVMEQLALTTQDSEDLLSEANKLINPDGE